MPEQGKGYKMKKKISFVAVGQAAGNIGRLFEQKGYSVIYVNTSQEDLNPCQLCKTFIRIDMRFWAFIWCRNNCNRPDAFPLINQQVDQHRSRSRSGSAAAGKDDKDHLRLSFRFDFGENIVKVIDHKLFCFPAILVTSFPLRYMILEFCIFQCIKILL